MARVLLTEDDIAVCDFVRRVLEMDGHDVVPAHEGGEAPEKLLSPLEEFDLLLSDIRTPVMDRVAPASQAARDLPDLSILLMTGYAEYRNRAYGLDAIIRGIVQIPFMLAQIRDEAKAAPERPASAA